MRKSHVGKPLSLLCAVTLMTSTVQAAPINSEDRLTVHAKGTVAWKDATLRDVGRASRSSVPLKVKIKSLPIEWQRLAMCESSWRLHAVSPSGKHHGLFQIHQGFFTTLGYDARTATFEQQVEVAAYVMQRQGAKAWTCARKAGLR